MTNAISSGYTVDRESFTIRFERSVDADASDVFNAWTRPEEVSAWWDPDGEPLVACTIDLRVGGSFSFATRQHSQMPFAGVYSEITPPTRLVFDALGATGRVILDSVDGRTLMVIEIICSSEEHLQEFIRLGVADGTSRTVDNLVAYAGNRTNDRAE